MVSAPSLMTRRGPCRRVCMRSAAEPVAERLLGFSDAPAEGRRGAFRGLCGWLDDGSSILPVHPVWARIALEYGSTPPNWLATLSTRARAKTRR